MKICVISDIHYKYKLKTPEDRENAAIVLEFLDDICGRYELLVLNGDIFDLYNEWEHLIIRQYFPLLHRLANIRDAGCRITYISGNHDFWFNGFLDKELGFELFQDKFELNADGQKMVFTHGDLYTTNDLRYQLFRRLIRMRLIKTTFNLIHPNLALKIGEKLSRSSRFREVSQTLLKRRGQGLKSWARQNIEKGKADIVILGHSHDPQIIQYDSGFYANAGDWLRNHSYLEIDSGKITLNYYKKKENAK